MENKFSCSLDEFFSFSTLRCDERFEALLIYFSNISSLLFWFFAKGVWQKIASLNIPPEWQRNFLKNEQHKLVEKELEAEGMKHKEMDIKNL